MISRFIPASPDVPLAGQDRSLETPLEFEISIARKTAEAEEEFGLTPFLFINIARDSK
jgi:hypothetical protein